MPRLKSVNGCSGRSAISRCRMRRSRSRFLAWAAAALIGPGVDHVNVGPRHFAPARPDRRQDLLVNPPVEPQFRAGCGIA